MKYLSILHYRYIHCSELKKIPSLSQRTKSRIGRAILLLKSFTKQAELFTAFSEIRFSPKTPTEKKSNILYVSIQTRA